MRFIENIQNLPEGFFLALLVMVFILVRFGILPFFNGKENSKENILTADDLWHSNNNDSSNDSHNAGTGDDGGDSGGDGGGD